MAIISSTLKSLPVRPDTSLAMHGTPRASSRIAKATNRHRPSESTAAVATCRFLEMAMLPSFLCPSTSPPTFNTFWHTPYPAVWSAPMGVVA